MSETRKAITRRAGIVGLGTLSSRILGLVRESVIVALFPKEVVDAYQTAFMIPNSFRRLTAEGAFSPSIISVFSKIRATGDPDASRRFIRAVFGFSLVFLLLLTLTGVFGARWFTWLASWGSGGSREKFELAVGLTGVMFPYVLLISLTALAMGLLNVVGKHHQQIEDTIHTCTAIGCFIPTVISLSVTKDRLNSCPATLHCCSMFWSLCLALDS